MKQVLLLVFVLLAAQAFGQTPDLAAGTYAENGRLITLTNIQGLKECPTKNVEGKVKKIKVQDEIATFRLGHRDENVNIEVDLKRLAPRERRVVLLDMIRDRYNLRVAGYVCTEGGAISAFSLYREE